MAVSHLTFNDNTHHGQLLRDTLTNLEEGVAELKRIVDTMTRMIDGDGSQAAHFPYMTEKFSFPDDATAKAAWDELNSLLAKLDTDASVTNVKAALAQAFAKFR